ncbi:TPA: hypothetical protein QC364_000795 [Bacillus cereus]|nr:hypothetical protein [Bacillus cereus]
MTKKLSTVKKSVSFREDVFKTAEDMANKYFGGNFSAYLTYLVCADKHGLSRVQQTEEIVEKKEEIKENVNNYVKNDANEDYINSILGM